MDPLFEIAKNQNVHIKQFEIIVKAVDDLQTRVKELEAYKPNFLERFFTKLHGYEVRGYEMVLNECFLFITVVVPCCIICGIPALICWYCFKI